jgi:hypothetical protein
MPVADLSKQGPYHGSNADRRWQKFSSLELDIGRSLCSTVPLSCRLVVPQIMENEPKALG